jgi:hypothetical protein
MKFISCSLHRELPLCHASWEVENRAAGRSIHSERKVVEAVIIPLTESVPFEVTVKFVALVDGLVGAVVTVLVLFPVATTADQVRASHREQ